MWTRQQPRIHVFVSEGSTVCVCVRTSEHTPDESAMAVRLPDFKRSVEGRKGIMGILDYHVQSLGYVVTCNTLCVYVAWRVLARGGGCFHFPFVVWGLPHVSSTPRKQERASRIKSRGGGERWPQTIDVWVTATTNWAPGMFSVLILLQPPWIRGWWKADGFICWSQTPREVFDSLKWNVA